MSKDYYKILGIDRTASDEEIKRTYRKLAMRFHPDRNHGDKEAERNFKEASEAYAVLSDSSKRAQYDRFGHVEGMPDFDFESIFSGAGGFGDIFGDIFSDFFGGSRSSTRRIRRGNDLQYNLELSFKEATFGVKHHIEIPRKDECPRCEGLGAQSAADIQVCPICQGSGQQRMQQGFFAVATTCSQCGGKGKIIAIPCKQCKGYGVTKQNRRIQISIPPGIHDGTRLRLKGEGEAGEQKGPHGDLYLRVRVLSHPIFERGDENDIVCHMPLDFISATLGGVIIVPTLDSKVSLKIPPGTESGKTFRIRGHGISSDHSKGDLYVRFTIVVPSRMSKKQKQILEEFQSLQEKDSSAHYPAQKDFEQKLAKI